MSSLSALYFLLESTILAVKVRGFAGKAVCLSFGFDFSHAQ